MSPGIKYDQFTEGRGQNFYAHDPLLRDFLAQSLAPTVFDEAQALLDRMGALVGGPVDERAQITDRDLPPRLIHYDKRGEIIDEVVYNAGYQQTVREIYGLGIVGLNYRPFAGQPRAPFALTFALGYLLAQTEAGFYCPVTLTGACALILSKYARPAIKERYLTGLVAMNGEPLLQGATWATEKTGGSDVGANQTIAREVNGAWRLTGEKWFASNADAEVALVTARPEGAAAGTAGLGLFLVPRHLPDGRLNGVRIKRLKDKLGTRCLATGELELIDAQAELLAPPPQGFQLMMEALEYSRLCNAVASIGIMRRAFFESAIYAHNRRAFGETLASYPLVQDTLTRMLVDLEAAAALVFETIRVFDRVEVEGREEERHWLRLLVALAKYRTAEMALPQTSRAIELHGGNGYVEEFVTARLYRDAQVLPVWEGPANIQALEVLRLLGPKYRSHERLLAEIDERLSRLEDRPLLSLAEPIKRERAGLAAALAHLSEQPQAALFHARHLTDYLADVLTATLLLAKAYEGWRAGNAHAYLIAQHYLRQELERQPQRGITSSDDSVTHYFDRLLSYQVIAPAEVTGA